MQHPVGSTLADRMWSAAKTIRLVSYASRRTGAWHPNSAEMPSPDATLPGSSAAAILRHPRLKRR